MSQSDEIQKAIDQGRGYEAEFLGQTFDIYRNNELIFTEVPVLVKGRMSSRRAVESAVSLRSIVMMEMVCDATNLEEGDVFQGEASGDRYVLSTKRPLQPVIAFRTELPITLKRPVQDDTPVAPGSNKRPYAGRREATDYVLTYDTVTNEYSFTAPGDDVEAATVYAGKSQLNYTGAVTPLKLPLDTRITRWAFAMEILPGITIKEADYIVSGEDTFQVYSVDEQIQGFNGQVVYADLVRP